LPSLPPVARLLNFDLNKSGERRHSITVCETPASSTSVNKKDRKESNNNRNDVEDELIVDPNEDTRDRVASIWAATAWGRTYDCLSLTLDEVQHIRSVLTKAELESLGVTRTLREDLEKGKICFTCLKTRFSFFGPWRVICKLCERTICEKCATTMHVPSDCLAKVPVYMLSPTPSPPGDEDDSHYFPKFPHIDALTDQLEAEAKKASQVIKSSSRKSNIIRALTLSAKSDDERSQFSSLASTASSDASGSDVTAKPSVDKKSHYHGHGHDGAPLMKLCRDCKLLVRHLIDVGHTNYDSELSMRCSTRRSTIVAS